MGVILFCNFSYFFLFNELRLYSRQLAIFEAPDYKGFLLAPGIAGKGVGFIVTDQDIDTTTPTGKLLFNILGSLAEFERDLIKARCAEGIKAAKAKGVQLGRKPTVTGDIAAGIKADVEVGEMTKGAIAAKYQVSRQTVYRLINAQ